MAGRDPLFRTEEGGGGWRGGLGGFRVEGEGFRV